MTACASGQALPLWRRAEGEAQALDAAPIPTALGSSVLKKEAARTRSSQAENSPPTN